MKTINNSILIEAGLTENEARTYLFMLEKGIVTPPLLVENLKIKRVNSYAVLKSLVKKGLAEERDIRKKLNYRPLPPDGLIFTMEEKKKDIERTEKTLNSIIPELNSLYNLTSSKPGIVFFEGVEGIKKIYDDTLKVGEPIYAFLTPEEVVPALYHWLQRNYTQRRVEKGIEVSAIVSQKAEETEYTKEAKMTLRNIKVIKSKEFPFSNEINVYGNKVAIMDFRDHRRVSGYVIESKFLSETMRSIFRIVWG